MPGYGVAIKTEYFGGFEARYRIVLSYEAVG
jgi:hypothetical protein